MARCTDRRGPTSFSLILDGDKRRYKAKPKGWRYATVSTGLSPTLALWGYSVSGGGLLFRRPKGHTQGSEVNAMDCTEVVSPAVKIASDLPLLLREPSWSLKTPSMWSVVVHLQYRYVRRISSESSAKEV